MGGFLGDPDVDSGRGGSGLSENTDLKKSMDDPDDGSEIIFFCFGPKGQEFKKVVLFC